MALRAKKKLEYDSANMKITNDEAANKYFYPGIPEGMGDVQLIVHAER